jgi:FkbM family methyltransferase
MEKFNEINLEFIPIHITHIKLDIGLSYNAPNSNNWLNHDDANDNNTIVLGFEPNEEAVKCILAQNIKLRDSVHDNPIENKYIGKKFFVVPCALSNNDTPVETDFYIMKKDCGTSSLYKPLDSNLGSVKTLSKVWTYSLKHFFDKFPWHRFEYIDYIKIDAQGSDLDILKGANNYLQEKVVYITAEPENNAYENCGHNSSSNISNYLLSQNFVQINHPNTTDPTFINKKYYHLKDSIYISQK